MLKNTILLLSFLMILIFISCIREDISDDPNLRLDFSTDTISFDTVFTTIGSTTKWFRVKNPNRQNIKIGKISLALGKNSPFRLNIDGKQGIEDSDITINGGDSIFVFVEVTVDPNNTNNPMVIKDSIIFQTNGNVQDVNLIAFGQDFHLFNGEVLKTQHWKNDKPYLIYNSVLVDSLQKLTIDAGCRIHFHKKSSLFVYGTLNVNGTFEKPVVFQGDRLEKDYSDVPGQWGDYRLDEKGNVTAIFGGIHLLLGSRDNVINYATIKNGNIGIQADSLGSSKNPMLQISNTKIENMSAICLDARNSEIIATNCVFANSGSHTIVLLLGGSYEFNHCTVANFFGLDARKEASVLIKNYYDYNGTRYVYHQEKADFRNCIIYGSNSNEIAFDKAAQGVFNYRFTNCLLKTNGSYSASDPFFTGSIFNKDPKFKSSPKYDYSIDSLSPAKNIARLDVAKLFPVDIASNSRLNDEGPDIGAYEWIPKKKK